MAATTVATEGTTGPTPTANPVTGSSAASDEPGSSSSAAAPAPTGASEMLGGDHR